MCAVGRVSPVDQSSPTPANPVSSSRLPGASQRMLERSRTRSLLSHIGLNSGGSFSSTVSLKA